MTATNNRRGAKAGTFPRDPLDWYVEGRACSRALFRVERFPGGIHDPCCGQGNIVREAIGAGLHNSLGTDLKRRVAKASPPVWWGGTHDFHDLGPRRRNIVCNPPFFKGAGTEAFIRKALDEPRVEKVAIFTDLSFLAGAGRWDTLYRDHPASRAYIITPRPSCPPGYFLWAGGKAQGGTANWVWIIWDRTEPVPFRGPPLIRLDIRHS